MNKWVGLGFVALIACSSSESSPTTTPPADDAGTTATGTPMTVWIYSVPKKAGDQATPIGGATVAFDPPGGGERIELTTEADGHATANMDFTKGAAVVTATAPGSIVVTALEASPETNKNLPPNPFGKPSTDMILVLDDSAKTKTANSVEISGKFTNRAAEDSVIGLGSTGVQASYQFPNDTYAARVPKGQAFALMCFEGPPQTNPTPREFDRASLRVFRVDHAAIDANTPLDIDVSQGTLQTTTVHWTLEITGGDTGPLGGTSSAGANVISFDSGVATGFFKKIALSGDKTSFDVEELVAQTDLSPEITRTFTLIQNTDGSASIRQMLGSAPDGTVFKDFMAPPAVAVTKQTRADAFAMDGLPPETETVNIQLVSGQDVEWFVLGPYKKKPAGPITLPAPPTGAQLSSTLKANLIVFADFVDVPNRPGTLLPQKVAFSRPITVTK